ncbi:MAG: GyrI-like domain-containing protein [Candidatus Cloacimonadales bacterium]|jgi:AraC family transcriptional regulator|nr:GyrI-like domain-containing protein [Candidatus Cloacimonadota bacterium]MDY0381650.1 GyrI-like domain-containing protein [Candidatus Cloacimonadaceae bacterium]HCM15695.1 hypothetical protein [Candidatus Cloacimonas sp.]MCB5256920.1 GyrI-like domain-containing protein [Candidatus Cloacimonadota bacterium]MCB5263993.1 GyrI-like domain-containing protein [Candidatus Cloacimonadota bacterium]
MKEILVILLISFVMVTLMAQEPVEKPVPKMDSKAEMKMVGIQLLNSMDSDEMSDLWRNFATVVDNIPHRVKGPHYGISFFTKDYNPQTDEGYGYMAAVEVSEIKDIPHGCVSRIIPASDYAVFSYEGNVEHLGDMYAFIYGEWMRSGEVIPKMQESFEEYDINFNPEAETNIIRIWVPVNN